jgi:hypothetical protein
VEQQKQDSRLITGSIHEAGKPRARPSARKHSGNPTALALIDDFSQAVRIWASRLKVSPNKLFGMTEHHQRSVHWMRERYFGGVVPTLEEVEWVKAYALAITQSLEEPTQLKRYKVVIEQMCRTCVGAEGRDRYPKCWDATCPLRPISPLPLADSAKTKAPLDADRAYERPAEA